MTRAEDDKVLRRANARLAAAEQDLYPVVYRSLRNVVQQITTEAGLPSPEQAERALVAAIRPSRLQEILKMWEREVDDYILKRILRLFLQNARATLDSTFPNVDPSIFAYVRDVRAEKMLGSIRNRLVRVGDTLFKEAREALQRSMAAGEGNEKAAARVAQALNISEARARVIARTESAAVLNASDQAVSDELAEAGIAHQKRWIATMTGPSAKRTRDSHKAAHGQTVLVGQAFKVGPEGNRSELMFPGDPSGPAAETIQCRCCVNLVLAEVEESLVASWTEKLHPRGLDGRFINVTIRGGDKWTRITDDNTGQSVWVPNGQDRLVRDFLGGALPADRVKTGPKRARVLDENGATVLRVPNSMLGTLRALNRDEYFDTPDPQPESADPDAPVELTWGQVKEKYPAYAEFGMDHAVNEFNDDGTGEMTTSDLRFTEETVDLRDVRFQRYGPDDDRVSSLREGYTAGQGVPPVLLVERNGELFTVDGHHRLSTQEAQGQTEVRAVIAHSTRDTPYTGKVGLGEVAGRGLEPTSRPETFNDDEDALSAMLNEQDDAMLEEYDGIPAWDDNNQWAKGYAAKGEYEGNAYARWNRGLRSGNWSDLDDEDHEQIAALDKFIEDAGQTVPEDGGFVTYRGGGDWGNDVEVGSAVMDRGFGSTAVRRSDTLNFGRVVAIEMPPGSRYIVGSVGEREAILPRGTVYEVIEVEEGGFGRPTRVRVVPPPAEGVV